MAGTIPELKCTHSLFYDFYVALRANVCPTLLHSKLLFEFVGNYHGPANCYGPAACKVRARGFPIHVAQISLGKDMQRLCQTSMHEEDDRRCDLIAECMCWNLALLNHGHVLMSLTVARYRTLRSHIVLEWCVFFGDIWITYVYLRFYIRLCEAFFLMVFREYFPG